MQYLQKIEFGFFLLLVLVFMNSCISSKKIKYVQKKSRSEVVEKYKRKLVKYKLQSTDNVYVKFSSLEPISNEALSSNNNTNVVQGIGAKYRDIYQIDSLGFLSVPHLGEIYAKNLNLQQLKDSLENKIQKYYQQVTAQVRLADNYVTIIGNVNNPGRYQVDFREQITIFELIGMAGDLSIEANRKEVRLLRNTGDETEVINLDLTKRNIIESNYYYLMPNDIIYAPPLRGKTFQMNSFIFSVALGIINAGLVVFALFQN